MKDLVRRNSNVWLDNFFGLKNWMFGWDDELLLEKVPSFGDLVNQRFEVLNDKDRFCVRAQLPGYGQKDIRVEVKKGVLSVGAQKEAKKEVERKGYFQYQNSYQAFQRSFILPKDADARTLKTAFKDGRLEINLAKKN